MNFDTDLLQEQAVIDNFNAFFRTAYLLGRIDASDYQGYVVKEEPPG